MNEEFPHDRFEQLVTDHALGRLADDDARTDEVLAHLAACATCPALAEDVAATAAALRALAPLDLPAEDATAAPTPPALDARIEALFAAGPPDAAAEPQPQPVVERTPAPVVPLRSGSHRRVGAPSTRRPLLTVAAAAAVVGLAVGSGITALVSREDAAPAAAPGPVVVPVAALETEAGVTATAGVVDHTWGVELKLTTEGLPAAVTYAVVVTGDDGVRYDAGAFVGVSGRPVVCNMNSGVLLAKAASFAVLDPSGTPVVWGDLPEPATT